MNQVADKSMKQRNAKIIAGVLLVVLIACVGFVLYRANIGNETTATSHVYTSVSFNGWDEEISASVVVAVYEGDVAEELASGDETLEAISEVSLSSGDKVLLEDVVKTGAYTLAVVSAPELEHGYTFTIPDPTVVNYDGESTQTITFRLTVVEFDDDHNWETNYVLELVDAVTHTEYYDAEYEEVTTYHTVCNTCLAVIDGEAVAHINETGHSGYSTNVPITNDVLVADAYTETVVDEEAYYILVANGERCSICEKTRNTSDV